MAGQIQISDQKTARIACRMTAIAAAIEEQCAAIETSSLGTSSGATAQALLALGEKLKTAGGKAAGLARRSASSVLKAAGTYVEADELSLQMFWGD